MAGHPAVLPGNFGDPERGERRDQVRFACTVPTLCRPSSHSQFGGTWPARAYDLSSNGLALILSRRFEPGTRLIVELQGPGGESSHTLLARVVRVVPHSTGFWKLGCSLVQPLNAEELRLLVQAPSPVGIQERLAG
jgi:hypothetical protein